MYVEHRFLNMFQALEAFDRRRHVIPALQREKHEQKLERIYNRVETQRDRKWLQGQLRYSHEPRAVDRLRGLIEEFNAAWIFEDVNEETELAGNLRNFHTHYDLALEPKLPPAEERVRAMHNLAARFQLLCEIILLREVGFAQEDVKRRMDDTERLQHRLAR
jgi:hypothetical protein